MSENSSDSDSSCGWTVISHEGSDMEALASENEGPSGPVEPGPEESVTRVQEEQQEQLVALQAEFGQSNASSTVDQSCSPSEPAQEGERERLPEGGSCVGAVSDDSDIATLETPKIEEIGSLEDVSPGGEEEEEVPASEDFNMGSSSSSQYAFCRPEAAPWLQMLRRKIPAYVRGWLEPLRAQMAASTLPFPVFLPHPSGEESSSDETSNRSSPTLRRRRTKKRLVSSSESEDGPPREQETELEHKQSHKHPFSRGLNRCIVLALVIAVSMGFGHFYGTIQIQKRQLMVEKTHEDELNDVKDHLLQCQQGQEMGGECRSLKEGLATCLLSTEMEKKSFESQKWTLASENQHLRESLEREEKALALLQEELRKLREQIRHLENLKGTGTGSVVTENQKLKAHLEEEMHRRQSFVQQKKALFTEAQMLRRELDKERQLTEALREELEKLSSQQASTVAGLSEDPKEESQEIKVLRGRLEELEKKLSFEQQRSDLWEKLYVEVKDHVEKQEQLEKPVKMVGKGAGKAKKKPKATFFGSVKETFDAMKNSTKEFVRHHKEKIKQAKEAVKENLRKFSDSVKSTFRHFKDTTKNIFEEREKRRYGDRREEATKKAAMSSQAGPHKPLPYRAPGSQREFREARWGKESRAPHVARGPASPPCNRKHCAVLKGCSGIFDCAHQEFVSLFNQVLDPIRADEFNQLMHKYLQQEVENFHHWRELDVFISQFFRNGVFIHDQMLFTDFVNDIKDYLEDMKEYQRGREGVFEDVDNYIYTYYFHQDPLPQQGPSQLPKRASFMPQERPSPKYQQRHRREGKWHKQGRSPGRHVANVEIEWGRLPLDPKY
ncbi:cell cycle progression protein 1 isoform X2 [Eublepharis macularius]|uniref:Cell cycle progression protein 1 isoform X2 n=1 Tax=Eublepharis macularius TaxID=481883 RepID=A0AA97KMT1_EUBMA|nr:cell cycle progression protein 1 isoform X2 [Eublepharis macularius]